MIKIIEDSIVVMSLVDLEHCGFDVDGFHEELQVAGIENPASQWPIALLVDFAGGAVLGSGASRKKPISEKELDAHLLFRDIERRVEDAVAPEETWTVQTFVSSHRYDTLRDRIVQEIEKPRYGRVERRDLAEEIGVEIRDQLMAGIPEVPAPYKHLLVTALQRVDWSSVAIPLIESIENE